MKKLAHIGTAELLSLVDDHISNIPAKIDTGADGSSIWASNIHLEDDKLVFNFFAPGSAYYQEKPVITTAYKVASVKNSFGQSEFRYKIRLAVQVGEYKLTRWFSLANRSKNTYPVLLGKNFLKNHFIVDVSRKFILSKPNHTNKILVLSTKPTEEFFNEVNKYNKEPTAYQTATYNQLAYYLDGSHTSVVNLNDNKTDVANYAFTYFKSHAKHPELAAATAEYLNYKSRPFVDRELLKYISNSKLSQYMKLNCYNFPVPASISATSSVLRGMYSEIIEKIGKPFVLKEINSDQGKNNYLIDNKSDFTRILGEAQDNFQFMAQKYIPNEGFLRVYVFDKEAKLAIWRSAHTHSDQLKAHLNKPAGGVNAKLVDLSDISGEVHDICTRAAVALDRQVSGIDLVQDKETKRWYILEVNNAPQIRKGSFQDKKAEAMAQFFDRELRQ